MVGSFAAAFPTGSQHQIRLVRSTSTTGQLPPGWPVRTRGLRPGAGCPLRGARLGQLTGENGRREGGTAPQRIAVPVTIRRGQRHEADYGAGTPLAHPGPVHAVRLAVVG